MPFVVIPEDAFTMVVIFGIPDLVDTIQVTEKIKVCFSIYRLIKSQINLRKSTFVVPPASA